MKAKLGLEMRPVDTQEVQPICNCCGQPYYPNKSWEDRIKAIILGLRNMPSVRYVLKRFPPFLFADQALEGLRRVVLFVFFRAAFRDLGTDANAKVAGAVGFSCTF